ncbi:ATP-binding protein [Herpetosiphon geysericola]|uniref:RecF/RecN/SMC N-terminal domain-containing protein n=1 Tax=Herpetosiphon geysericola TaxID=70996 RepID=A0A0P6Y131_9CHLR|nr:ATP-binding protein [Herpetosiphon geysericola]KPL91181.1 hypothetical protein SE18_03285 [Herpetosiphon geysericola]
MQNLRVNHIALKNFRAFYGEYNFDTNGKHFLVYGENGSGKSSLYHALYYMLNANQHQFNDHINIFSQSNDGYIKLELVDQANPSYIQRYEWTAFSQPNNAHQLNRYFTSSRFLDYKELLRVYYLSKERGKAINLFDLIIDILGVVVDPVEKISIKELWTTIEESKPSIRTAYRSKLYNFSELLRNYIELIRPMAEEILEKHFKYPITLEFTHTGLDFDPQKKEIFGKEIDLKIRYRNKLINNYHEFLNEAKLSAIALAVYFAGLKKTVLTTELNLLVLDDVLIGFDMANRLPIIGILKEYFYQDYQIICLTYDKAWFEILKNVFEIPKNTDNNADWQTIELYHSVHNDHEQPLNIQSKPYLDRANEYFAQNDYKAAGVYLRSGFEELLKKFAKKYSVPVRYDTDKLEDFWQAISADQRYIQDRTLIQKVTLYKSTIINPLNHDHIANFTRREVGEALGLVERIAKELKDHAPSNDPIHADCDDLTALLQQLSNELQSYQQPTFDTILANALQLVAILKQALDRYKKK